MALSFQMQKDTAAYSCLFPHLGQLFSHMTLSTGEKDLAAQLSFGFVLTLVEKRFPALTVHSVITYKGI